MPAPEVSVACAPEGDVFWQCQRCTACCRWPGQVRVTEEEITRIAAFLQMGMRDFIDHYTELRPSRRGLELITKIPRGPRCVGFSSAARREEGAGIKYTCD